MAFHELLCVAMSRAEKQHVYAVQWKIISENQIRFTVKTFVNVGNLVAGVTRTIYENYFYIGVIKKQANKFACRISRSSYNSYFNHIRCLLRLYG